MDSAFRRETVVDVDAAVVGISRERWIAIHPDEANAPIAPQLMEANSFDVLPVDGKHGTVTEYFRTRDWNKFDSVDRRRITYADVIPYHTPIRDVIRMLSLNESASFFSLDTRRKSLV